MVSQRGALAAFFKSACHPNVVLRKGCYISQIVGLQVTNAWDYIPLCPVPVLYKRIICGVDIVTPYGPHIVRGNCRYCIERCIGNRIEAGYNTPTTTVPMLY